MQGGQPRRIDVPHEAGDDVGPCVMISQSIHAQLSAEIELTPAAEHPERGRHRV